MLRKRGYVVCGGMRVFFALTFGLLAGCTPPDPAPQVLPTGQTAFEKADCRIVRVVDGDTIRVACGAGGTVPVRLAGLDTPETFRPQCASERARGRAASLHLTALVAQADRVDLQLQGRDKYGRALGRLTLDGRDVARHMIAEGHARAYTGGRRQSWCD